MPTDRKGSAFAELTSYPTPGNISFVVLDLGEAQLANQNKRAPLTTLDDRYLQPSEVGTLAYINDAPSDGSQYARQNGAWAVVAATPTLANIATNSTTT